MRKVKSSQCGGMLRNVEGPESESKTLFNSISGVETHVVFFKL